jgi:hypothetical protein
MFAYNKLFLVAIPLLLIPTAIAAATTTPTIKTEMNTAVSGVQLVNSSVYLSSTDGDFHLKNTLAESRDFVSVVVSFSDIKTDNSLSMQSGFIDAGTHVSPGATVSFDVETGYKASEANQLASIKAMVTA